MKRIISLGLLALCLVACGGNGPTLGDKPPVTEELAANDPVVLAINACDERIRGTDLEREPGTHHTTDSRTQNRWIVTGEYTVKATGEKIDYTCTVTKTPGYDELAVDVPLTD